MTLPGDYYEELMLQSNYVANLSQQHALTQLDRLYLQLLASAPKRGLLSRMFKRKSDSPKGIYLWGGVGRGKSFLMDMFFDLVPQEQKLRVHMHAFMQQIHSSMGQCQGQVDPLKRIAKQWAAQTRLICIDEFVVNDVVDAMVMAELLEALYAAGLVLVMTSNVPPERLYADGLQRQRFLPAIELLQSHNQVVLLETGMDYRQREISDRSGFYRPLGQEQSFEDWLKSQYNDAEELTPGVLSVLSREIMCRGAGQQFVWFDFEHLCQGYRSQADYLALSQRFETIVLTGIPRFGHDQDDMARRFLLLIDVLYDQRRRLLCSAETEPHDLYQGRNLSFEFERTVSRLIEMTSEQYRPNLNR